MVIRIAKNMLMAAIKKIYNIHMYSISRYILREHGRPVQDSAFLLLHSLLGQLFHSSPLRSSPPFALPSSLLPPPLQPPRFSNLLYFSLPYFSFVPRFPIRLLATARFSFLLPKRHPVSRSIFQITRYVTVVIAIVRGPRTRPSPSVTFPPRSRAARTLNEQTVRGDAGKTAVNLLVDQIQFSRILTARYIAAPSLPTGRRCPAIAPLIAIPSHRWKFRHSSIATVSFVKASEPRLPFCAALPLGPFFYSPFRSLSPLPRPSLRGPPAYPRTVLLTCVSPAPLPASQRFLQSSTLRLPSI